MDTLAFISRYEAILKDRKIPKMQFYRDCDITDAAVSQWRKGKTKPAMTTISKIAEYLGVTAEYLLTGEGQKEKPASDVGSGPTDYELLTDENKAKAQEYIRLLLNSQS